METRDTGVVETPSAGSTVSEVWNPIELVAAQATDPELAVVHGWRIESEELHPWCDVIDHSEATKEYWAQWDLLELSGRRSFNASGWPEMDTHDGCILSHPRPGDKRL